MTILWIRFINNIFRILNLFIVVRVVLSWVSPRTDNAFMKHFYEFTDLLLYPAAWILHQLKLDRGMWDWSPFLTMILLGLLQRGLYYIL